MYYTEKYLEKIDENLPVNSNITQRFKEDIFDNIYDFIEEADFEVTYLRLVQRYGTPEELIDNFLAGGKEELLQEYAEFSEKEIIKLQNSIATIKRRGRNIVIATIAACALLVVGVVGKSNYYNNKYFSNIEYLKDNYLAQLEATISIEPTTDLN